MKTQDLVLKTDWIVTDSIGISWYRDGQIWCRYDKKDGKIHGDCKTWYSDGVLWLHDIYENGELVKRMREIL